MELKIIEQDGGLLKFEVVGEGHTLCNALRKELWNDKNVNVAGYNLAHPLIGNPVFAIDCKGDPKKVLMSCVDRLRKNNKELVSLINKNLK